MMLAILEGLGVRTNWLSDHEVALCAAGVSHESVVVDRELSEHIRASFLLAGPLLAYIDALERQQPDVTSIVTVLLPEYIPAHWWEHVLHTQTALMLKGALLFRPRTAVLSVPYHLED